MMTEQLKHIIAVSLSGHTAEFLVPVCSEIQRSDDT